MFENGTDVDVEEAGYCHRFIFRLARRSMFKHVNDLDHIIFHSGLQEYVKTASLHQDLEKRAKYVPP